MGYLSNRTAVKATLEVPIVIEGVTVAHHADLEVTLLLGADDDLEDIEIEGELDNGLGERLQRVVYVSKRSSAPFAQSVWQAACTWLDTPQAQMEIDAARMEILSAA